MAGNYLSREVFFVLFVLNNGRIGHRTFDKSLSAFFGNGEKGVLSIKSEVYSGRTDDRVELTEYLKSYLNFSVGGVPHNVGVIIDII